MLISKKKKFIFIHIFKTAGTSVTDVFVRHSRLIDRLAYQYKITSSLFGKIIKLMKWEDDGMKQFTGFHKHAKADEVLQIMGESNYNRYFTFAFVRNPFDHLVSLYFYIKQSPWHKDYSKVNALSFEDYIIAYINEKPELQVDFLTKKDTKECIVDFIGRLENFNLDLNRIADKLKIELSPIKYKNISSKRKEKDFHKYYNENLKKTVEDYFARDLKLLGYSFDGIDRSVSLHKSITMDLKSIV